MVKMRKILALLLALLTLGVLPLMSWGDGIETQAKSLILVEGSTGKVLYELNADESLPPASVTKIMTLLLVFEAIEEGKLRFEDPITVSEQAAKMGGSQVYLEQGEQMTVDELLKCVVIASANDAAAALAEAVSGSLESFVSDMNRRAAELGMSHSHFENTNGLDDTTTTHLTSARDIAIMSKELLKHEKIFDYTTIWMDTVRNGAFGLTNTNRLIRFYNGANGLKTGSTSKAGFCISATAKRDGMQLIDVVMGSPTRDERNATAAKLLDYGFARYEVYNTPSLTQETLPVLGGKKDSVLLDCTPQSFVLEKGQDKKVEILTELPENLKAPVEKGQILGKIVYKLDGTELSSKEICAKESVDRLSKWDLFKKMFSLSTLF